MLYKHTKWIEKNVLKPQVARLSLQFTYISHHRETTSTSAASNWLAAAG